MNFFLVYFLLLVLSFQFTQLFQTYNSSTFSELLYVPLFTLLILLLFTYLSNCKDKLKHTIIWSLFILIVVLTVGKTTYTAINMRHFHGLDYPVHDNPIQLEVAIQYLKQGKNPYTENYLGTMHEEWFECETCAARHPLYHFITLPFYVLSSLVLSYPLEAIFGFFDQRMIHVLSFSVSCLLLFQFRLTFLHKLLALTLFIFNPLFIHFFIEGRNDIVVFTLVFMSIFLLQKKKILYSSLFLGLAFATKQSSWLLLPFYFWYVWLQVWDNNVLKTAKLFFSKTWFFFISVGLLFIPFLVWDAYSFFEDIYLFPSGAITTSYPITGYGFSQLLLSLGFLKSMTDPYPSLIPQMIFGIPILLFFAWYIKQQQSITSVLLGYMSLLFVFWIFSRFFMNSYVGYLSMICLLIMIFFQVEDEFVSKKI
jgi:hypothetical protein